MSSGVVVGKGASASTRSSWYTRQAHNSLTRTNDSPKAYTGSRCIRHQGPDVYTSKKCTQPKGSAILREKIVVRQVVNEMMSRQSRNVPDSYPDMTLKHRRRKQF